MCHNYNRYFISAETKLLIARYIATSANEEDDKGLDIDGEMNLDLSPMQPAQEAMRLFTGVSKGVIGKDHDGTTELCKLTRRRTKHLHIMTWLVILFMYINTLFDILY